MHIYFTNFQYRVEAPESISESVKEMQRCGFESYLFNGRDELILTYHPINGIRWFKK